MASINWRKPPYHGLLLATMLLATACEPYKFRSGAKTRAGTPEPSIPTDTKSDSNGLPTDTKSDSNGLPSDTKSDGNGSQSETKSDGNGSSSDTNSDGKGLPSETKYDDKGLPIDARPNGGEGSDGASGNGSNGIETGDGNKSTNSPTSGGAGNGNGNGSGADSGNGDKNNSSGDGTGSDGGSGGSVEGGSDEAAKKGKPSDGGSNSSNAIGLDEGIKVPLKDPSPEVGSGGDTPLVLDWNRDGRVRVLAINERSPVRFDLRGDGERRVQEWIELGDAFLALDVDDNGQIDSGRELFGDAMRVDGKSQTLANGFLALSSFDGNRDRSIDAGDPVFKRLLVWHDRNMNATSEASELIPLHRTDIIRIHLQYRVQQGIHATLPGANSRIWLVSDYETVTGKRHLIADVYFHVVNQDLAARKQDAERFSAKP